MLTMRVLVRCCAFVATAASSAMAQSRIRVGASAGVAEITDQRSEQALGGVIEYDANRWLSMYAIPVMLRVSDSVSGSAVSSSGLGDLPLVVTGSYTSQRSGSPTIGAALVTVLPTGDAACGLGSGQTAVGMDLGVAVSPGPGRLAVDVSRSLSGIFSQSSLGAPETTTLHIEAGYDVAPRWTGTASFGVDLGPDSSQALSRMVGAAVRHTIAGPLMISIDGSHGLTAASPQWLLSVSIGTAFASSSPVAPTTPLRRVKSMFGNGNAAKIGCR